jgi:hypothetical protein
MHDETNKLSVFVELLVECKAFDSPMVFLERPKNERELRHANPREYVFPLQHYRKQLSATSYQEVPPFVHLSLGERHYYYRAPMKATQFSKIVKKGKQWIANHEGIYDSLLLPLAKAVESRREDALKRVHGAGWKYVWLFFPIVVLRERLFAMNVAASQRSLEQRKRITFVRHIESGNVKGFCLSDFVVFAHVNDYIRTELQPFADYISKLCTENPRAILNTDAS